MRTLGLGIAALAGLLAIVLAVLLTAPAGLASRIVAAATPELQLFAPSGRLLAGSADLVIRGRAFGRLAWDVDPLALAGGRLAADLSLADPDHGGRAQLALHPSGVFELTGLRAEIREGSLDALLRPYAIEPSGRIEVHSGRARGDLRRRRVLEADGEARWTGGLVRYRLGGGSWTASFPSLDARLRVRDGAPVLVVRDPRGEELLDAALRAGGWADLRVRYRFVALAGYPWPDPPAPDVIVVELSERIL